MQTRFANAEINSCGTENAKKNLKQLKALAYFELQTKQYNKEFIVLIYELKAFYLYVCYYNLMLVNLIKVYHKIVRTVI